jgi:hypothetical protein
MNSRIQSNDKPVFEIDAHVVLRLNAGDNVIQQLELTRADLSIFIADVFDPLLGNDTSPSNFAGIDLENGTAMMATRVGRKSCFRSKGRRLRHGCHWIKRDRSKRG